MIEYPTRLDTFDLDQWGTIKFRQWMFNDSPQIYKTDHIDAVSALVPPGSFAVDIGAYTGDTAIPMALATGSTGKVVAFEPGPGSFPLMVENLHVNNPFRFVDVAPYAVTSRAGIYTFHYIDGGYINGGYSSNLHGGLDACGNRFPWEVRGVSLSEYLSTYYEKWLPKWSYCKIDTEGYDKNILYSNGELFRKYKPTVLVEVYPFLTNEERLDLQAAIKYIGYAWDSSDDDKFFAPVPEVHNILCRPRSS